MIQSAPLGASEYTNNSVIRGNKFIKTDKLQPDLFLVRVNSTPLAHGPKSLNIFVKLHVARG